MTVFFTENVLVVSTVVEVTHFCNTEKNSYQIEALVGMEYMFYSCKFHNVRTRRNVSLAICYDFMFFYGVVIEMSCYVGQI